jgi:N-acetylglutamate synthase-like GNAT family acetyltransferase
MSSAGYVQPPLLFHGWIVIVRHAGKAIMAALLQHAKSLGCKETWVLTERSNRAAMHFYASAGGEEAKSHTSSTQTLR